MSSIDASSRFSRRAWQRRLRSLRPLLIVLGIVVVLVAAVWVVAGSSLLAARDVEVTGERTVTEEQVRAAAEVDVGEPLVRVDLDAIEDRVASLAVVGTVDVHRSWPHTVTIEITERQPVATLRQQGSWWVVDADGVVFRDVGKQPELPVITLAADATPAAQREAAAVVGALPGPLRDQVRTVSVRSVDSITLKLAGDRQVQWGSSAESDRKVEVLTVLLREIDASVYDVSVPEQPTTTQ